MYFSFFLVDHFYYDILCTLFSYIWWWCIFIFLHLLLHVLFLFHLYSHVSLCTQSLFLFHIWCLNEFCLSVQKDRLWKSIILWTLFLQIFEEFVVGIDLVCNTTSGYELSDLRLLSWLFVLLWFCHRLPKGEIVRDIFIYIYIYNSRSWEKVNSYN